MPDPTIRSAGPGVALSVSPDMLEAAMRAFYGDDYDGRLLGCSVAIEQGCRDSMKEAIAAAMERAAAAALSARAGPVATITELRMTAFADALPVRDELKGEQTILTYSDAVGVWGLDFYEAGWEFPDRWLGASHWLDITEMWPGVIAQVASFHAAPSPVAAGEAGPAPSMPKLVELVLEMADAVDAEAEDIGGVKRGSLDVLVEAVKVAEALKRAPAPPAEPVAGLVERLRERARNNGKWLGELLAVIHRDGGHYQALHGNEKAVADAHLALSEERADRDRLREALTKPGCLLFLDGRNEHGSHVLMSLPSNIPAEAQSDVEDQAEDILLAAERFGFRVGCDHVWTEWRWNKPQIGDEGRIELPGYWEFVRIDSDATRMLAGELNALAPASEDQKGVV